MQITIAGEIESMNARAWRQIPVAAVMVLALGACGSKGTLDNSREEQVRVEGRLYEVRIAKTDMADTWRMLIVRGTVAVFGADPELERMRAQNVAKPFMERTCQGRPYEQSMDKLQDDVNYYTVFTCRAAA
jgi:hypothetical protein